MTRSVSFLVSRDPVAHYFTKLSLRVDRGSSSPVLAIDQVSHARGKRAI